MSRLRLCVGVISTGPIVRKRNEKNGIEKSKCKKDKWNLRSLLMIVVNASVNIAAVAMIVTQAKKRMVY